MTSVPVRARVAAGAPGATWWVRCIDAVAFAAMIILAALPLGPAYGDVRWLWAVGAGALVGAVAGVLPVVLRWPALTTVALAVVGYMLIGPAAAAPSTTIAGFLPSVESVRVLGLGVVSGWKQLLTVADPVGTAGGLLIPAMLIGLVVAAASTAVAGRLSSPLWALAGPAVVFVAAAGLGTVRENLPIAAGAAVAVIALAWGAWRTGGFGPSGIDLRRPYSLAVVVVLAVGGGVLAAPWATPDSVRATLRDAIDVQFDPQVYPSPLGAFRRYVKADASTDLFTVTGLPADGRIRLATMDSYDGLMYDVSADAGSFVGIGGVVRSDEAGTAVTLDVTVDGYVGVWVPDLGALTGISFGGPRSADLAQSLRYSKATGTAVVTEGLKTGDSYQLSATVPADPDEATLKGLGPGSARLGQTSRVPSALATTAASWTENQDSAYDKVEAIRSALSSRGLLDHGQRLGSPSGHGYDRLLRLLNDKNMVGDQEQFAPTMALMVQSLGIPARVVMGWQPKGNDGTGAVTVTGADVTAWVEVNFDQVGWVAFDPTPDESRVQQQPAPQPDAVQRQQVLQPPPPPRVPHDADASEVQDTQADDKKDDHDDDDAAASAGVSWVLIGSIGIPLLLILLPILVIVILKMARRRRFRKGPPVSQLAGQWERLLDGAVDLGSAVPAKLTRTETAGRLDAHFGGNTMLLAAHADARIFGPGEPGEREAREFADHVERELGSMRKAVSPWRRLRAKISTVSLRREASR